MNNILSTCVASSTVTLEYLFTGSNVCSHGWSRVEEGHGGGQNTGTYGDLSFVLFLLYGELEIGWCALSDASLHFWGSHLDGRESFETWLGDLHKSISRSC